MNTTEFVTAEHSLSPARGVWVLLSTISMMIDGEARPVRFEVTTSTGYWASLPACLADTCGTKTNCTRLRGANGQHSGQRVAAWREHIKTHCHDFHFPRAKWFAEQVAKTYKGRSTAR
jgi:hypothetical protein